PSAGTRRRQDATVSPEQSRGMQSVREAACGRGDRFTRLPGMSPKRESRSRPPTVTDIRRLRTEFIAISRSLEDARSRAQDYAERGRIDRALEDVNKRIGGLKLAIERIEAVRARQESYTQR